MRYIMLTVLAVIISSMPAHGSMITFTQTGMAAGYFLETEYYNRPYVFTATGDLSKIHSGGWIGHEYPGYQVDLITASVTVEGLGTVNLPSGYYSFTVSPLFPASLHMNVTGPDPWTEMTVTSSAFSGWDMKTSLEPVYLESLETHGGFEFPKYSGYPYQYIWDFDEVAIFSATVIPVPEPSTMMLLALGLIALLLFSEHHRRAKGC